MSITAKVIADSISENGHRITTFELEYPRFIHAEFMTHRLFSRNAASSRAIPVKTAIELIQADTAMPIHWGKNQPGMSAKEECNVMFPRLEIRADEDGNFVSVTKEISREEAWNEARDASIKIAEQFAQAGYHKQIVNRILEPFSHIKVVCTATEYDNFFYLRCHPDAQPEIQELANQMWDARAKSIPKLLKFGEWHVPYFREGFWTPNNDDDTLEDAKAVSSSCCAQVSYRKLDDSIEKARDIFKRLVDSKPVHASPFEHQATPMEYGNHDYVPEGITHFTVVNGNHEMAGTITDAWSGNFRGWIQHRHLIPDNTQWRFSK